MILAIKTDNPVAELYLLKPSGEEIDQEIWIANRELSRQILEQIQVLLNRNKIGLKQLSGLVVFQGPGSFTGLRIGISVGNSLAYGLNIPITGVSGKTWIKQGLMDLKKTKLKVFVVPKYGSEPNITKPRK